MKYIEIPQLLYITCIYIYYVHVVYCWMGVIIGLDKPLTNWDAEPFVRDEWIDNGHGDMNRIPTGLHIQSYSQWEFQEPKLEVPTICKAYLFGLNFREYPQKI